MQNNLKKIREERGWSQAKLAGMLGVDQRYIDRYEKYSDMKISVAIDIANALQCSLADLFGDNKIVFNDQEKAINTKELLHFVRLSAGVSGTSMAASLGITDTAYRKIEDSDTLSVDDTLVLLSIILSNWQNKRLFEQSALGGEEADDEKLLLHAYRSVIPSQKEQLESIIKSFLPKVNTNTKTKSVSKK